jgi:predicted transcriptional regulator
MSTTRKVSADITRRKHKGNKNSVKANLFIANAKTTMKALILWWLKEKPEGLTYEDISIQLAIRPQSVSGRISELKAENKIVEIGTRKLFSGVSAAVYKAKK